MKRILRSILFLIPVFLSQNLFSQCFVKQTEGDFLRGFGTFFQTFKACNTGSLDQVNFVGTGGIPSDVTIEIFTGRSLDAGDLITTKSFPMDDIPQVEISSFTFEYVFDLRDEAISMNNNVTYTIRVTTAGQSMQILKSENSDVFTDGEAGLTTLGDLTGEDWAFTVITDPSPEIGFIKYGDAFDILKTSYQAETNNPFSIADEESNGRGLSFSEDGLKMYIVGLSDEIYQYELNEAFNVTTASFNSAANNPFSISAIENTPEDIEFSIDGMKMYILGRSGISSPGRNIHYFNLTTAFDITTASFAGFYNLPSGTFKSIEFSRDGYILYISGNREIHRFDLNTAYDMSSAVFNGRAGYPFSISDQVTSSTGLDFSPDGRIMVFHNLNNGTTFLYNLTSPFEVNTASFSAMLENPFNVDGIVTSGARDLQFSNTGDRLIFLGFREIVSFDIATGDFSESITMDNGAVSDIMNISITGDTFADVNSIIPASKYAIPNLPQGLTPQLIVSPDGLSASLSLSGNSINHLDTDDIASLFINFDRTTFGSSIQTRVINKTSESGIGIDFNNAPFTWDGSESDNWSNADNWENESVPSSTDNVIIPDLAFLDNGPVIGSATTTTISNLIVEIGGRLTISRDAVNPSLAGGLTITEDFVHNADPLDPLSQVVIESGASFRLLGNRSGDGNQRFERSQRGNGALSIIGSPFENIAANQLFADYLYAYDVDNEAFTIPNESDILLAGKGYFAGAARADYTISLEGKINSGAINIPVSNGGDRYNLVANPYAAAISFVDFINNENNDDVLSGAIYMWNDGGDNSGTNRGGSYLSVTKVGNTSFNRGTSDPDPLDGISGQKSIFDFNGNIGAGQGFFVQVNRANSEVQFTPDMQASGNNQDQLFYRNQNGQKLSLSLNSGEGKNAVSKNLLIGFLPEGTDEMDYGLDAINIKSGNELDFYTYMGDDEITILALPELNGDFISIPLGFDVETDGEYYIKVDEITDALAGRQIVIYDTYTDESYELSNGTSFTFQSEATSESKRFFLEIQPGKVTKVNELFAQQKIEIAGYNQDHIQIGFEGSLEQTTVYDSKGGIIFHEVIDFTNGIQNLKGNFSQDQLYIIKIGTSSKKFILK